MTCQEIRTVVDAYVDGELSPIDNREIEQHLCGCTACSNLHDSHQAVRSAMRTGSLYRPAPSTLRNSVRSSFRPTPTWKSLLGIPQWRWAAIAASLALVSILTWRAAPLLQSSATEDPLIQEVTANHVRSLMVSHLVDVPSSDRHVVKPWFTGKLDFSPSVVDLTDHGFPLIGGRLDYLDKRPVAAVVYKRREHVINLFIQPTAHDSPVAYKPGTPQGYHLIYWIQSGMTYWAISDLNIEELQEFVQLVRTLT
jgi:anti-sigma factor (TIGR02949 family)